MAKFVIRGHNYFIMSKLAVAVSSKGQKLMTNMHLIIITLFRATLCGEADGKGYPRTQQAAAAL